MVLNAFTHTTGLEVGVFFNASEPQFRVYTGEYEGELSTLTFPKISTVSSGNTDEKAVRFRLVSGFTESSNDLPPQDPRFYTPAVCGPKPHAVSNHVARAEEVVLDVSFNTQSQVSDIPGTSSRTAFSEYAASLQVQSKGRVII